MDVGNIAELNTFLVLDAVRSHGRVTRSQLARELGLSNASVSRIVKRLLDAGTIAELPGEPTARGRTPAILQFVGPIGAVIAVDLGGTQCHGALADLAGGTVAEDFRTAGAGGAAADRLLACIAALKAKAAELDWPVRAVVVGIPALIDPATGLATAGPNVHWQGFDLIGALTESLAEPFEVDNDVNLGALGQAWRGAGRGISSFVLMSLGTGIGGALVIDGHLIRGRHNAAGELAYFPVARFPFLISAQPESSPAPSESRGFRAPEAGFPRGFVEAGGASVSPGASFPGGPGEPDGAGAEPEAGHPRRAGALRGADGLAGAGELGRAGESRSGFEDVASGLALRARAIELAGLGLPTTIDPTSFELADVFKAALDADDVGQHVVRELTGHVAAAIAGTTALVDPDRIILDGSIGRALRPWLGELQAQVEAQVFRSPEIVISELGPNATVIGAIARALAMVTEQELPAKLPPTALRPRVP
jgi:predicted NBD/HSP70 family sugar kinase